MHYSWSNAFEIHLKITTTQCHQRQARGEPRRKAVSTLYPRWRTISPNVDGWSRVYVARGTLPTLTGENKPDELRTRAAVDGDATRRADGDAILVADADRGKLLDVARAGAIVCTAGCLRLVVDDAGRTRPGVMRALGVALEGAGLLRRALGELMGRFRSAAPGDPTRTFAVWGRTRARLLLGTGEAGVGDVTGNTAATSASSSSVLAMVRVELMRRARFVTRARYTCSSGRNRPPCPRLVGDAATGGEPTSGVCALLP